jgi:hypothetical protein
MHVGCLLECAVCWLAGAVYEMLNERQHKQVKYSSAVILVSLPSFWMGHGGGARRAPLSSRFYTLGVDMNHSHATKLRRTHTTDTQTHRHTHTSKLLHFPNHHQIGFPFVHHYNNTWPHCFPHLGSVNDWSGAANLELP